MANDENLEAGIQYRFSNRSAEETARASANGRKGGHASGKVRGFKSAFNKIMSGEVQGDKKKALLDHMNVPEGSRNHWMMVMARIIADAENGNTGAQRLLLEYSGDRPQDKIKEKDYKLRKQIFEYQKAETQPQEAADDSFLAALNGTASADWENDDEEG